MIWSGSAVHVYGLGIMVCLRDKTVDGGLEIDHPSEDTAV